MTCLIMLGIVVVLALFLLTQAASAGKTEHGKPGRDDPREF